MMAMFSKLFVFVCVVSISSSLLMARMPLDECREKSSAGDAEALWQLGQRYEKGLDVRKDNLRAVSLYKKAAEKKHANACMRLAELHEIGKIVAKDSVKAARYWALAKGENAELAAALAKTEKERVRVDHIEVALDHIIGRNGCNRDAKKGIQILYNVAKSNPTAQRVFVERWERGDLDEGLDMISGDDWTLVLPWFQVQYDKGRRKSGLVLGNAAYREKQYYKAIRYWKASGEAGLAKSWFLLGKFYLFSEEIGGGPKFMQSDIKAKDAFEHCLRLDSSWKDAEINIGYLCVFGDGKCIDYPRAMDIFSEAMKKDVKDERYPYWYGLAGQGNVWRKFNSRWSEKRLAYLLDRNYKNALNRSEYDELKRYLDDVEDCFREEERYMQYVLRSANKGYDPAKRSYQEWKKKKDERISRKH